MSPRAGGLSDTERSQVRTMERRDWSGAPLLSSISSRGADASLLMPTLKKRTGKKREGQVMPALDRIVGYTGSDISEEEVRATT